MDTYDRRQRRGAVMLAWERISADPGALQDERDQRYFVCDLPNPRISVGPMDGGTRSLVEAHHRLGATIRVVKEKLLSSLRASAALRRAFVVAGLGAFVAVPHAAQAAPPSPGQGFLPDGRAWEKVTPSEKNGSDVIVDDAYSHAAHGGLRVAFSSNGAFSGAESLVGVSSYLSERSATGWGTRAITPPQQITELKSAAFNLMGFSDDLGHAVLRAGDPPLTPDAQSGVNLYSRDLSTSAYKLLAPSPAPVATYPRNDAGFVDASDDFRHVVFEATRRLTPDAPIDDPLGGAGQPSNLYESVDGVVRLVGVLPDGTAASGGAFAGPSRTIGFQPGGATGANNSDSFVSDDGSRIFWSDIDTGQLYVRISGIETRWIARSQRATPDPAGTQPPTFQTATPDGSRVYFTSIEKLTDDSTAGALAPDLYEYTVETGLLRDLTVDIGRGPAVVLGVLGISNDGNTLYFAASGDLAPGSDSVPDPDPFTRLPRIYVAQNGTLSYVATLSTEAADSRNWQQGPFDYGGPRQSRVTKDGRFLLFSTVAEIRGQRTNGTRQLYRFDLSNRSIVCVSCLSEGGISDSPAFSTEWGTFQFTGTPFLVNSLLQDGRVIFNTRLPLAISDTNGRLDVYLWTESGARLISSGRGQFDSYFGDASESGDDIFFITRDRLSGWDTDSNTDLYDARVGGGLPEPAEPAQPCSGALCQGIPAPRPDFMVPPTGMIEQDGNLPSVREPARAVAMNALTSRQRNRLAQGKQIGVRVRARKVGMLKVTLTAQVNGRARKVASRSQRLSRAGNATLKVKLPVAARRQLKASGRLEVKIQASLGGDTVTRAVTLRSPRRRARAEQARPKRERAGSAISVQAG